MILYARISGAEIVLDDEEPGTLTYSPEYIEDVARRLGRQVVDIYQGAVHGDRISVVDLSQFPIGEDAPGE